MRTRRASGHDYRTGFGDSAEDMNMLRTLSVILLASVICLTSCNSTVKLQGDKQEPIHIVMDINIRLDKELDAFFDFEDEIDAEVESVSPQSKRRVPPAEQLEKAS